MDVVIRRVAPGDGPVLRDLRVRSLRDAPEAFGEPLEEAEARAEEEWTQMARQAAAGASRAWFVAERPAAPGRGTDTSSVGIVLGRRRPPASCLLFSMWVDPSARGTGVGRRLVEAVERWARASGAREVVLWVTGQNERALPFYRALGYEVVHEGPDAESGRQYGAWAMRRALEDAPVHSG